MGCRFCTGECGSPAVRILHGQDSRAMKLYKKFVQFSQQCVKALAVCVKETVDGSLLFLGARVS